MNPYEVLGVSENADEETIKKAYRSLVKKYHPDKYVNSPLADMAAEKMKEINQAYDMITGKDTQRQAYQGGANPYSSGTYTVSSFQMVRALIAQARIREAMAMLQNLPRNAEWYYLSGRIYIMSGWYDQGISFLRTAVNMDPNNAEYRDALNNIHTRNQTYSTNTTGTTDLGCCSDNCCNCCTALACMQCCC